MTNSFKKARSLVGERDNSTFLRFDHSLKLEFCGTKVTSNAGLLVYRELDEIFGLSESLASCFTEFRTGNNTKHKLLSLIRQSVYSRLSGYEDVNDADLLKQDPALRIIVGGKAKNNLAASTSEMNRFETEHLTQDKNINALRTINGHWITLVNKSSKRQKELKKSKNKKVILDIDSSESKTYGSQEGTAYNGHFGCTCYHPLFCFNQYGDLEGALLREGNVHSANNWKTVIEPIITRYQENNEDNSDNINNASNTNKHLDIYIRGDAAFGSPEFYEYAEENNLSYVVRLKGNLNLYEAIGHFLVRQVGRPSYKPRYYYHSFYYHAKSWNIPRRVVAKVEWHYGELFPRIGFIVTNLNWSSKKVIKFYNKRGTAEQWIKEGKNAVKWTKLSCHRFVSNEVRLLLFALAYNLGNFLRTLALPKKIANWSLTTLKEKLIKLGAKTIKHARYIRFQIAEFIVTGKLFGDILKNIHRLQMVPG